MTMKKTLFIFFLPFAVFPALLAGRLFPSIVSAQSRLVYPIPDLGYCRDAKECSLYCEIPENKAACWSYGKYKLGSDVLGVSTMSDEEKRMMENKAKQYNITFPIADLGNCAGPQECRDFCEQPANQTACMAFAKKKGFDKEIEKPDGMDAGKRDELLGKAKTELGCTSMESCSRVCESDHSRCEAFAKKHGMYQEPPSQGRYSSEEKQKLIQKAKSEMGCTSMKSCRSTCEKDPQRCMDFAKKHGFDKGQEQREQYESGQYQQGAPPNVSPNYGTRRFGKENCDSEDSCKKYCQEHPDECPGFKGYTRAVEGSTSTETNEKSYVGPSGCRNEAECKNWCETNPDKCPGFSEAKTQEEQSKREYELRKKEMEYQQESQKRQFETNREMMQQNYEYRPPTTSGGSGGGGPSYQTTQPSSGSYTPPSTQPAAP